MPTFTFSARDTRGQWHRGSLAADSSSALAGALRARGLSLVSAKATAQADVATGRKAKFAILPASSLDVEMGLRMLANMLDGGITLLSALKTCSDQARRARMANIWNDVSDRIEAGLSFTDALSRHKLVFPKLVIQLAHAGEISGNLEFVMERAADQLERKRNLLVQLFSAMMYPAFAIIIAVGVTAYLMVKVIPEISGFLEGEGRQLPPVTLALIATSNFMNNYFYQIIIFSVAVVAGLFILHMWQPAGKRMDAILLRIPIVGKLMRLAGTAMFARGLSMLLEAGVPVISALETAGGLMKNLAISGRVEQARQSVLAGNTLAKPLAAGKEFMPMLPRMIAVGEETGTMSTVLVKVANFHEQQLESYVKRMTLLIEPIMTVVVGGLVGFVYLAFFMAIYSTIGHG
jgi:type II secretory pathway component PulF